MLRSLKPTLILPLPDLPRLSDVHIRSGENGRAR
jgi:hypothetical protein